MEHRPFLPKRNGVSRSMNDLSIFASTLDRYTLTSEHHTIADKLLAELPDILDQHEAEDIDPSDLNGDTEADPNQPIDATHHPLQTTTSQTFASQGSFGNDRHFQTSGPEQPGDDPVQICIPFINNPSDQSAFTPFSLDDIPDHHVQHTHTSNGHATCKAYYPCENEISLTFQYQPTGIILQKTTGHQGDKNAYRIVMPPQDRSIESLISLLESLPYNGITAFSNELLELIDSHIMDVPIPLLMKVVNTVCIGDNNAIRFAKQTWLTVVRTLHSIGCLSALPFVIKKLGFFQVSSLYCTNAAPSDKQKVVYGNGQRTCTCCKNNDHQSKKRKINL